VNPSHRLHILDLLRFGAALAVLFYHVTLRSYVDHDSPVRYVELESGVQYLNLAVQLFFMISGFVVVWSAEGKSALQFAWSRFARLFPTFWFCATITWLVCHFWGSPHVQVSFSDYLKNLTMLEHYLHVPPVDLPYWTLKEELRFYAIVFGCLLVGYRNWFNIALGWLALCFIDYSIHRIPLAHYEMSLEYAPFFAAGIIFYQIHKHGAAKSHIAALCAALVLGCLRFMDFSHHDEKVHVLDSTSILIITGLFMLMTLVSSGYLRINRYTGLLTVLGGITYPLYLLHNRLGAVIYQHLSGSVDRWTLLVCFTLASCFCSWLVWKWIDVPVGRWLSKHRPSWINPVAPPPPEAKSVTA
jgi:peptidoglycan/LPS O-acetylase OafA/YrhL